MTGTDHQTVRNLSRKALSPWLMSCGFDWLVIAAALTGAGILNDAVGYILAVFIIGNRQHGLALLGHDGTHFMLHKTKWVNDLVSDMLAFWMLGLSTSGYRYVHFPHHKYLNTAEDPELKHRSTKAPQWDLPVTPARIGWYAILDLFGYSVSDYMMIVRFAKADSRLVYAGMAALHGVFIAACIGTGMWWIAALWYVSLLTTFMMFFRIRTWLEHQGSADTHRMKLSFLENAILAPHQSWHHYEHHAYPMVPLHRLARLRKALPGPEPITIGTLMEEYRTAGRIVSGTPTRSVATDMAQERMAA